ncbi:hypothetical protein JCM3765_000487 [Sporobolomyces pararoseus]
MSLSRNRCPSNKFLATGPLVGLAIAGTFLFEGLVGALVWLAIVLKRSARVKKKRESTQPLAAETLLEEAGETSAYTHRSSFVEKWLGKEAVTTYTPVEIEESVERTPYASYAPGDQSLVSAFPPPPSRQPSQRLPPASQSRVSGDVSFYSTAIAASLVVPSQLPAPYDPPTPSVPPLPLPRPNRPELPKLDIPSPPLPPSSSSKPRGGAPSITSQISYLRKLSRSLTSTLNPTPSSKPPPSPLPVPLPIPMKPNPPTPPPFMNNLNPPFDSISSSSCSPPSISISRNDSLNFGSTSKIGRNHSQRIHLPVQSSGLAKEL